jgi:hypothetical protein
MIDVVPPCLDEAEALPGYSAGCRTAAARSSSTNRPTDDSAQITAANGAPGVHEDRRGSGATCHAGLPATISDVVMDANVSLDLVELLQVVAPLNTPALGQR